MALTLSQPRHTLAFIPHLGDEAIELGQGCPSLAVQENDLGVLKYPLSWAFASRDSESGLGAQLWNLYFFQTPAVIVSSGHSWEPRVWVVSWVLPALAPSSVGRSSRDSRFGAEFHERAVRECFFYQHRDGIRTAVVGAKAWTFFLSLF